VIGTLSSSLWRWPSWLSPRWDCPGALPPPFGRRTTAPPTSRRRAAEPPPRAARAEPAAAPSPLRLPRPKPKPKPKPSQSHSAPRPRTAAASRRPGLQWSRGRLRSAHRRGTWESLEEALIRRRRVSTTACCWTSCGQGASREISGGDDLLEPRHSIRQLLDSVGSRHCASKAGRPP